MPISFTQLEDLAKTLLPKIGDSGIVGIDGWTGVGKTTLAKGLAELMNGSFYDLDCALTHNQKEYVAALRMPEILNALAEKRRPLMVSGICLLEVLEKNGTQLDAHIYMKRMASWGWADEDELDEVAVEVPGSSGEVIRREMRLYHERWQPHLQADYEFHRDD